MLIDTSVFIAAERGQLDLDTIITAHQGEPVALAAITASELLHGVHRARTSEQRSRQRPLGLC
jgi:tRNA(fMet)-specific endonuclease VapC